MGQVKFQVLRDYDRGESVVGVLKTETGARKRAAEFLELTNTVGVEIIAIVIDNDKKTHRFTIDKYKGVGKKWQEKK